MKKLILAAVVLLPLLAPAQDAVEFEKYFADRTMRIDVFHTGDAQGGDVHHRPRHPGGALGRQPAAA